MFHLRTIAVSVLLSLTTGPLVAQEVRGTIGPLEQAAARSSPENPVPRRTSFVRPTMPDELVRTNSRGVVTLVAVLDASGRVAEMRMMSAPLVTPPAGTSLDEAAHATTATAVVQSAAAALRQWTYAPPATPIAFVVAFVFAPGALPSASQQYSLQVAPGQPQSATTGGNRPPPQPGQPPQPQPAQPQPAQPPPWPAAEAAGAVRALPGTGVTPARPIRQPRPSYTREAMAARVQGRVALEILIGTDGKVHDARVLQSIPLLDEAALETARQWEFAPGMRDGKPAITIATLEFDFNLRGAAPGQ
jgi:TonB family protein